MRVVSMLPAASEIVCALGAAKWLVGRSHECDFPAEIAHLPIVSRPRLDPSRPGGEIHASVKALLERSLAIYEIDIPLLRLLKPDVIVTQDQCDVCAVPFSQVQAAACSELGEGVRVVSLSPLTLAGVREDFSRVGIALALDPAPMTRAFDAALDAVRRRPPPPRPVRVLGLEWLDPPMAAGNWFAELLAIAGATCAVPSTERTERISWEAVDRCRADVTVAAPCGFDLARSVEELSRCTHALPGRVAVVDANAYINRPGPRLADSAAILADIVRGADACPPAWRWA